MSLSGISSSNLFNYENSNVQNQRQQFQQEFQQLGQDLQSGNLSATQTDFATLQQIGSNSNATSSTAGGNPLAQAFNQLGQDLQSGNLSAAQQDFSNIQQALQSQASQAHGHHHHHHGGGEGQSNSISQLLQQLGQSLQSGNVSSAQQIYNTIAQDLTQFGVSGLASQPASGTAMTGVSVTA